MSDGWIVAKQICSICGDRHISVHPTNMPRNAECPACGHFTCEDVELLDKDGEWVPVADNGGGDNGESE